MPTTYAGSEATDVWGLTEHGRKTTGSDTRVLPRCVVYDASLLLGLPVPTSVASGFNALAHCVDSMWAPRTDPIDQAHALEGIRTLRAGLPQVVEDPMEIAGREQTLYGAYLSAIAFASWRENQVAEKSIREALAKVPRVLAAYESDLSKQATSTVRSAGWAK